MALTRFIRPKSSLPIYRLGLSIARTRRFSSDFGENEKPMKEEKRIVAFGPAAKENVAGRPWCSLKNLFHNIKDTMLRPSQSQNDHNSDQPTPSVEASASMATASSNVLVHVCAELQDSELILQSQHAEKLHEDINGDNGASNLAGHSSSAALVDGPSSEVNEIQKSLQFPKSKDADALNMMCLSVTTESHSSEENCCDEAIDLSYSKVNELGKGSDEVSSSSILALDRLHVSNPENLSSSQPPAVGEESSIAEGVVASIPGLIGSGKVERTELKEVVKAIRGGSKKAKRLTDLFREKRYGEAKHLAGIEGTKSEESLSEVLLNLPEDMNSQFERLLPSGATSGLEDGHIKKLPPVKCENDPQDYEKLSSEGGEMSSPSNPTQKLNDHSMKAAYNQEAEEFPEQKSRAFPLEHFVNSNKPFREDEEKNSDIESLIDFIRQQKDVPPSTTNDSCNSGLIQDRSLNTNLQRFDNNKFTSGKYSTANSSGEDGETSSLDSEPIDQPDLKASSKVSVSRKSKDQKELENTREAGKESKENKVLVRFLRNNVTETQIFGGLVVCGKILKIEIHDVQGPLLKVASVYFETRDAVQRALKNSPIVTGGVVIVESATSKEKKEKIPIPSLIRDPDIPTALVKNPTRTVKIENLTHVISSRHVEEVLALSGINISGYFLGSSSFVAYVEFETETAKEKALTKRSINVLGRNVVMLRIDAPRTTVVRISNIQSLPLKSVLTVCKSFGDVRTSIQRNANVADVGFVLAEWPNMLNILNRLNGIVVEDRRLQAEPAPVFPADVLLALWDQPEGRKYVKATMHDLLHKLGNRATGTSEIAHMLNNFVDET